MLNISIYGYQRIHNVYIIKYNFIFFYLGGFNYLH